MLRTDGGLLEAVLKEDAEAQRKLARERAKKYNMQFDDEVCCAVLFIDGLFTLGWRFGSLL